MLKCCLFLTTRMLTGIHFQQCYKSLTLYLYFWLVFFGPLLSCTVQVLNTFYDLFLNLGRLGTICICTCEDNGLNLLLFILIWPTQAVCQLLQLHFVASSCGIGGINHSKLCVARLYTHFWNVAVTWDWKPSSHPRRAYISW